MSRIGNAEIALPPKVEARINGQKIDVKGPKGNLSLNVPSGISVSQSEQSLVVKRESDERTVKSLHGLARSLIANMVCGVSQGYTRELEINGVGYRAEVKGKELHLVLGFSHPVVFPLPEGITATVDGRKTKLTLSGIDKQVLGNTAAKIRGFRPPEPYRGKGIKYKEERIRRKEGKSAGK